MVPPPRPDFAPTRRRRARAISRTIYRPGPRPACPRTRCRWSAQSVEDAVPCPPAPGSRVGSSPPVGCTADRSALGATIIGDDAECARASCDTSSAADRANCSRPTRLSSSGQLAELQTLHFEDLLDRSRHELGLVEDVHDHRTPRIASPLSPGGRAQIRSGGRWSFSTCI